MTTLLWILGITLALCVGGYFYVRYRVRKLRNKVMDEVGGLLKDLIKNKIG